MAAMSRVMPGPPPLTHSAAPIARPASTPTRRTGLLGIVIVMEALLDTPLEEPADREGEGQGGQVAPGLDGVHGLSRHGQLHGQLPLAQALLLSQLPDV